MLMSWMLMKLMDPMMDEVMAKMMTEEYADNPFCMVTAAEKLTPRAMIEAALRAESGKELARPLGSPVVLSPWEKILLNPRQLFELPPVGYGAIDTQTSIGPLAKRPLHLDIPIMITGMSYGGSLSLPIKVALARGASAAGTSTNTGESGLAQEEREAAKLLIGQYNRGGWMNQHEYLSQLDAIEVQLGQGAWGGAVDEPISSDKVGDHLRTVWNIPEGQDTGILARMPGINSTQDIIDLISYLKAHYEVPVGVKIAGSDFIENELEVIAQTKADFIVIDGCEGGTSSASPTLEDNVGLPTLPALVRAVDWLEMQGVRDRFSLICAGGLVTPGHFLKALALGADAVYIGSIALVAAMQAQMLKVLPQAPAPQLILYDGKMTDKLDVEQAAQHLTNFLKSCTLEMQSAVQAVGKKSFKELNRDDLVTVDRELAEFIGIRYANARRHYPGSEKIENKMTAWDTEKDKERTLPLQ